ncbi:hypothetical protein SAY87_016352 [Trapa incisa]|uniref:non-specific serine/threonine protein kinase n=1 Tax=Trapa incisa TaxID=236973 RepID=A0AAN7LGT7_9MYRT|nr:hypothetical protein SAY87_016352 [Trapa incisa]
MGNLFRVNMAYNNLGGRDVDDLDFLCSLTNSTRLDVLAIGYNHFRGSIPQCISNLSMVLRIFALDGNEISGTLPNGIGNLINLEVLTATRNNFTGVIPTEIGYLGKLGNLYLHVNEFSGQIPHSIGNLSMLTELILRNNNLEGTIPSSLSSCQNLLVLDLSKNRLSGTIPPEIMGISSLSNYVDLSYNNLTGGLPMEVGNWKNLGILDLENNRISGEIPSSLGDCIMLEQLHLKINHFEGSIPPALSSLKGLEVLDLSNNSMSGEIPDFLEKLNLTTLGLEFNDFEGALPTGGVFTNASATFITGNKNLCGGLPEFRLPRCNSKEPRREKTKHSTRVVTICSISGLIGLLLVVMGTYTFHSRRDPQTVVSEFSRDGLLKVSYQALLKATNGFSSDYLIGSGSFGSVFRGVLDLNQATVAVKVINLRRYGAVKSFIAECEALRKVRHRNLVKIITACSGTDYQGNDFKALVYEYMMNGSLNGWLHPINEMNGEGEHAPRRLQLLQRVNIAIDVACALDYIHCNCDTPIVHCDLKPSNVLLDDEMTACVGDFGLVRFLPEATKELVAELSSSIGIKGSLGYIAPEYGTGGEVSIQGDVYSYGILVLEMFTGKRPTDEIFTDGLNLHSFAKAALPEHVYEVVDPFLMKEFHDDELGGSSYVRASRQNNKLRKIQGWLASIIRVGVVCSSEMPDDRMSAAEAVVALKVIQKELLQVITHAAEDDVTYISTS